jgi:propanol-preferring alcohol dehydrogenase
MTGRESSRAMLFHEVGTPLEETVRDIPVPGPGQVLIEVAACAPVVPGHEIVGRIRALGDGVEGVAEGDRIGVPWLGWTCGDCRYCKSGQENLCPSARFTGYQIDGGYAEHTLADARYCFPIADGYSDEGAAPLLCAGLIGHRTLRMAGDGERIGIYGFGAAAHIVAQVARHEGRRIFAFSRPGDSEAQAFAKSLGAVWAGGSDEMPPEELDAALIFAPVGALVPAALSAVRPGGRVVCGGIHMSDIPAFPYQLLWRERSLCSVANLTRRDGEEFLDLAGRIPVTCETVAYPLAAANRALEDLRTGRLQGAAVLLPSAANG